MKNESEKITILLVEDHHLIRKGVAAILEHDDRFQLIAEATKGEEAVNKALELNPDIILMDINLPDISGVEATSRICCKRPASKVIAMTMHIEVHWVDQMLRAGAWGYLSKNSLPEELFDAIINVYSGKRFLTQEIKESIVEKAINPNAGPVDIKKLSRREMQVANYIKSGQSTRQIAEALSIAEKTVEVHRYKILRKLKIRNSKVLITMMYENPFLLQNAF